MIHRIEILPKGDADPVGSAAANEIRLLGIDAVKSVRAGRIFLIEGRLGTKQVERIAAELLADPVVEEFHIGETRLGGGNGGLHRGITRAGRKRGTVPDAKKGAAPLLVEVFPKPGVMDPVALSTQQAIADMGMSRQVRPHRDGSTRLPRPADTSSPTLRCGRSSRSVLANDCIEEAVVGSAGAAPPPHAPTHDFKLRHVAIRDLDDDGLEKLSADGHLFLNVIEMKAIQDYYRRIGREPTDIELETLAQTWSEHCVHKTFRSGVEYEVVPIPNLPLAEWQISSAKDLARQLPVIQRSMLDAGYKGDHLTDWIPDSLRKVLTGVKKGDSVTVTLAGNR